MPVDIRSFFSKKAPPVAAAKNKKNKKTQDEDETKNDHKKSADSTATSSSSLSSTAGVVGSSKNSNDKKPAAAAASSGTRRKVVATPTKKKDNTTTTTTPRTSSSSTTSTTSKNKKETKKETKAVISVADFFAKASTSSSSSSSLAKHKKKNKQYDDENNNAKNDESSLALFSPPPHKKQKPSPPKQQQQHIEEAIDLSNDTDTDDDCGGSKKSNVKKKNDSSPRTTKRKREIDMTKDDHDDDDYINDESNDDDEADDGDEDYQEKDETKKKSPAAATTKTTSPRRQTSKAAAATTTATTSAGSKKTKTSSLEKSKTPPPTLVPELKVSGIDLDAIVEATPECFGNKTFVFTGILSESCSRDDAVDLVKTLGGRVTGQVSGKTDYLIIGQVLEDGRHYTEGSKYKKAQSINHTNAAAAAAANNNKKKKNSTTPHKMIHSVVGEQALYGLAQQYSNAAAGAGGSTNNNNNTTTAATAAAVVQKDDEKKEKPQAPASEAAIVTSLKKAPPPTAAASAAASKPTITNPYAKPITNPYAKKSSTSSSGITAINPYAAKKTNNLSNNRTVDDRKPAAAAAVVASVKQAKQPGGLWVDRYKPTSSKEILGNSDAVNKLAKWLTTWEKRFNHPSVAGKTFSNPNGPWKAALLSGPPGIGKTTTATLVALEAGRDVIEFNASDVRSKKAMHEQMGDITGSQTIQFQSTASVAVGAGGRNKKNSGAAPKKLRCIIMDEVDGMGAGDRSGVAELIQMIKKTKVPIIAICNDRQNQKLKSLIPYCMDLRYKRPMKTQIATRAMQVAAQEGWNIEKNAAEAIAESCGNDVRQVLNCLQMWASDDSQSDRRMTYKNIKDREKSINKDEVLRISLFDAARILLEGRKGLASCGADPATERDHFMRRNDAFFVDYNFTGLLVQQNYIKVIQGAFNDAKRANNDKTVEVLERMADAAGSMSDFALAEQTLRSDMNWSVLPFVGALVVKTGYHAGGESGGFVPGFPEFTTWLGRNSTKGKKSRLLQELRHHMNYHISCGTDEMRMSYVPVLRNRFLSLVSTNDQDNMSQAISLMDDYGLDRDDIFEKLDEFNMNPKDKGFSQIDSKKKAAFTRTYNAGSHTSQVLVAEQGAGANKKKKRKASSSLDGETVDPDAIDDDKQEEPEDEEEDDDGEKLAAAFLKKGKKKAAAAKKTGAAAAKKTTTKAKPKPMGKKKK